MRQAAREAQVRVDVLLEDEADAGGHQERQPHRDSEGEDVAEGNTHGAPPQLCGEYRLAKPERPLQHADEAEGAYGPDGGHHPTEQVMASPLPEGSGADGPSPGAAAAIRGGRRPADRL